MTGPAWSLGSLTALAAEDAGRDPAASLPDPIPAPDLEHKTTLSFADLEDAVGRAAAGLRAQGVEPGSRVGIVVRSELEGLLAAMAAARAGALPALLYGGLPERELRQLTEASEAEVLIGAGGVSFADLVTASGAETLPPPDVAPDVAALVFTSGTTGRPKGVPLRTEALDAVLRFVRLRPSIGIGREDRTVAALPLAHAMGFVLALAYLEARLPARYLPRFSAEQVLEALQETGATLFAAVPGMYRLLDPRADRYDLRSVRVWVSGADAMPRDLARAFQRRGSTVALGNVGIAPALFAEGYGLVEATGPALFRLLGPLGLMRRYRPLPGWRARTVDDEGRALPSGAVGRLQLSGPGVFRGYLGEDQEEREWLTTQDLAEVSRFGAMEIVGRSSDLLKVGGHRLHPAEVEAVLEEHPAVAEAGVVALPHEVMGEVPAAGVVLRPGERATPEELTAWSEERLASYKVPRTIEIIEEVPRTPTHKVKRADLAAMLRG